MGNSVYLSTLLPVIPFSMALLLFTLLRMFNRTVNRLTKPVSLLAVLGILFSTFLSLFFLLNHIDYEINLSQLFPVFKNTSLEIHLNGITEKIIILIGLLNSFIIGFSFIKLPRRNGYVLFVVSISFVTSILISGCMLLKLPL